MKQERTLRNRPPLEGLGALLPDEPPPPPRRVREQPADADEAEVTVPDVAVAPEVTAVSELTAAAPVVIQEPAAVAEPALGLGEQSAEVASPNVPAASAEPTQSTVPSQTVDDDAAVLSLPKPPTKVQPEGEQPRHSFAGSRRRLYVMKDGRKKLKISFHATEECDDLVQRLTPKVLQGWKKNEWLEAVLTQAIKAQLKRAGDE